ncbi:MAG: hypothetical protein HZB31_09990 [Nitrospirae bacterium]|nr:hypothetical protein [Nitrospirota bacterium]
MKNILLLLVILASTPHLLFASEGGQGIINVLDYGASADGDPSKAAQNTAAIMKAWNAAANIKGAQNGSSLYFPPGVYYVNKIGSTVEGFLPPKFVNISGAGPRKSVLKLADSQNSHLFHIKANHWFNASISDIGFEGNAKGNPGTETLVEINGYNIHIKDVYVANSAGSGLKIAATQQVRVMQVEAEFNKKWGIISENNISVTFDSVSCEHNDTGGLLIKSKGAAASDNVRYMAPSTVVTGGYFEKTPVGIELRGISGVEVHAGYSTSTFLKISRDPESGRISTGNIIFAQSAAGDVEIQRGNYGNTIIVGPLTKNRMRFKDLDGRNYIGMLGKAPSELSILDNRDLKSTIEPQKKMMTSWHVSGPKEAWKAAKSGGRSSLVSDFCGKDSGYHELATESDTLYSISINSGNALRAESVVYVQTLLEAHGSCKVDLQIYDSSNRLFYDWEAEKWTQDSSLFPVMVNGTTQIHQFLVKNDSVKRSVNIKYFISNCHGRSVRFYCTDVKEE